MKLAIISPMRTAVAALRYIAIAGRGAPGGVAHMAATEAQFTVAYALKFACNATGNDFVVPRQEGLWWFDDGETRPAAEVPRDEWNWNLLIRLPEFAVTAPIRPSPRRSRASASTWSSTRSRSRQPTTRSMSRMLGADGGPAID